MGKYHAYKLLNMSLESYLKRDTVVRHEKRNINEPEWMGNCGKIIYLLYLCVCVWNNFMYWGSPGYLRDYADQRCMHTISQGLINGFIVVYLNDIFIFSSSISEHIEHLNIVFELLKLAN